MAHVGWLSGRLFYLVNIVLVIRAASISNSNCPINCICQLELHKVNCSATNLTTATSLKQIDDHIRDLDLSHNELTQLPQAFFSFFQDIIVLNLSSNKISFVHNYAAIGAKNLRTLDLSNNLIGSVSDISSFIGSLNFLEILYLSGNPLTSLGETEDQILYSDSLLQLDVSRCQISQINGALVFRSLVNLISINLSQNLLTRIDGVFSNSLKHLDLARNEIQFLRADTLDNLRHLRELRIFNNERLTDQYTKIASSSITYLDASYCSIYSNYASDLPEVRTVILKGNLMKEILENTFKYNAKLRELDLSNNRITFVEELAFKGAEELHRLDLSGNLISVIPESTFTHTPNLVHLNFSYNFFRSLERIESTSLKYLDFSSCKIRTIVTNPLEKTPMLHTLNISYNFIEKLPIDFASTSLQFLEAAFCHILRVDQSNFFSLPQLKEINLSGNRLMALNKTTFIRQKSLRNLNLENNLWKCDCFDENFINFLNFLTEPPEISDKSTLVCQYPENVTGKTWEDACFPEWYENHSRKRKDIIILLIIIGILILCGIGAFMMAVRESCSTRRQLQANQELGHNINVNELQGHVDNDGPVAESFRKLSQLPTYDEALLLPRLSLSEDLEMITRKCQTATQTDDSMLTLLPKTTESSSEIEIKTDKFAQNDTEKVRRLSWDKIEYINMTPSSVQRTNI